ncbi:dihydrofolate reductase [Paracoccus sp. (in: a-proteobacteria)]|uniref:dihydrofolate reductase n=1 Tax=Paracoccus sp. TaxID=267 RepID=UPI0040581403
MGKPACPAAEEPAELRLVARCPRGGNVFAGLTEAIRFCEDQGHFRVYVIGGHRVFAEALPLADRLLLTEVATTVSGAEAFFPDFDEGDWRQIAARPLQAEPPAIVRELIRQP